MKYALPLLLLLFSLLLYYILQPSTVSPIQYDQLAGKVVLICGASSGIGEELAYQLAEKKAILVLVARTEAKLAKVQEEALRRGSPQVETIAFDFSDVAGSGGVVDQTIARFGRLDYLVSNHGAMVHGAFLAFPYQQDPAYIERIFRINLFSHIQIALTALPHLEEAGGHMFFTSSLCGELPPSYRHHIYASTKHAMNGFFYSLQQELLAKQSPVSLTIGALGLIMTKDLTQTMGKDPIPGFMKGDVGECAQGMMDSYFTRPRTFSYPGFANTVLRMLWWFYGGYQEFMIGQNNAGGYEGSVQKSKDRVKLAEEIGFQTGYMKSEGGV